jgi:hypothetical protein
MSKSPAFLFYYRDFSHGTRRMSFSQKGAYIELLCEQADIGHLSINNIKDILKNDFPIWETICEKFEKDEEGLFFNKILEEHINKRKNYVNSRKDNLKSVHMDNHMDNHMANAIAIANIKDKRIVKEKRLTDDQFIEELKKNYDYINYENEMKRIDGWLLTHPERKKTRRFIVNWFNKIDRPLNTEIKTKSDSPCDALMKIKEWEKAKALERAFKPA